MILWGILLNLEVMSVDCLSFFLLVLQTVLSHWMLPNNRLQKYTFSKWVIISEYNWWMNKWINEWMIVWYYILILLVTFIPMFFPKLTILVINTTELWLTNAMTIPFVLGEVWVAFISHFHNFQFNTNTCIIMLKCTCLHVKIYTYILLTCIHIHVNMLTY